MRRLILASLLCASCNQIFGLDPASVGKTDGPPGGGDGSGGDGSSQATCTTTGCSDPDQPVCDNGTGTCRGCEQDSECASTSGLCIPTTVPVVGGSCATDDHVAYLDPAVGSDDASCTQAMPCKTFAEALATNRPAIRILSTINTNVAIGQTVAILGAGQELTSPQTGPLIEIDAAGVTVRIYGLDILNAAGAGSGDGIAVDAGAVELYEARVENSARFGVFANTAAEHVTLSQSRLIGNQGGGLSINQSGTTCTFDITNSFIVRNGGDSNANVGGVALDTSPSIAPRFEYNTIADNRVKSGHISGVDCNLSGLAAPNNIVTENYVAGMLADGNDVGSATVCDFSKSKVLPDETTFNFVNATASQYELGSGSIAINQATTNGVATIDVDVDNVPRPQLGAPDIGASEYKP